MGAEAANLVLQIIENAMNIELVTKYYRWNLIQVDPDDNKFVDCAISSNAKFIVTNDSHFNALRVVDFPKVDILNIDQFKEFVEKEI